VKDEGVYFETKWIIERSFIKLLETKEFKLSKVNID
jgi:hypothetical protein